MEFNSGLKELTNHLTVDLRTQFFLKRRLYVHLQRQLHPSRAAAMLLFKDDENYSVIALVLDGHCQRLRSVHISPLVREQLNGSILNMNADTDNR
jgi:hypothetical protein